MSVPPLNEMLSHHKNFSSFWKDYQCRHKALDPKYSYRYYAKRLAVKSPATIFRIATKKRKPSRQIISSICKFLDADPVQDRLIRAMVMYEWAEDDVAKEASELMIHELRKGLNQD